MEKFKRFHWLRKMVVVTAATMVALGVRAAEYMVGTYEELVAAVAAAEEGDVIKVAAGTYTLPEPIVLDKGIRIESAVADQMAIFNGGGQAVSLLHMTSSGAVVSGIIFQNAKCSGSDYTATKAPLYATAGLMTDCVIRNCQAGSENGCTLHLEGATVTDTVFTNNAANINFTTGICMKAGRLERCMVDWNTAGSGAASAGIRQYGGEVFGCSFSHNSGSCFLHYDGNTSVAVRMEGGLMEGCEIMYNTNNGGNSGGAGVCMRSGTPTLRNCLIANNQATSGCSGLHIFAGTAEHITVVGNRSNAGFRDGVEMSGAGALLRNSIVYGNGDAGENLKKSSGTIEYTCCPDGTTAGGNITDAPIFMDFANGDYRVKIGSPTIDAGMELVHVTADLDGVERPLNGDGQNGAEYDMGCYEKEFVVGEYQAKLSLAETIFVGEPSLVACSPDASPAEISSCRYTIWDKKTGDVYLTTQEYYGGGANELTIEDAGEYEVAVTITSTLEIESTSGKVGFTVLAEVPEEYYVNSSSETPVWPFITEETAATSFADVIAVADLFGEACTIHVAEGNYTSGMVMNNAEDSMLAYTAIINAPYRVIGAGKELTTIKIPSGARGIWINHEGASMAGVTLTGCNRSRVLTLWAGDVRDCDFTGNNCSGSENRGNVEVKGGVLEDCHLTNNAVGFQGTLHVSGSGRAARCEISRNSTAGQAAMAVGVYLNGGEVIDCRIEYNKGNAYGSGSGWGAMGACINKGLFERCTVIGNTNDCTSYTPGAGVSVIGSGDVVIRNTLIAGNVSSKNAAGLQVRNAKTLVENVTVVGNENRAAGGVHGVTLVSGATMRNTIVYGNGADPVLNFAPDSGAKVSYSCYAGAVEDDGKNNQRAAPIFVDAARGDYRLAELAVMCINCGDTGEHTSAERDLAGVRRVRQRKIDIGAYEFQIYPMLLMVR